MIPVLQSTVEKPLTAIDYIAALEQCTTVADVQRFGEQVPLAVRQDDRFNRAVATKLLLLQGFTANRKLTKVYRPA